jgi:glycosyltransferase involved in cell wall biosynthesis
MHNQRNPLISIVLPVYNARDYLLDSVASIIEQSHRDWELICINDGSTDGSGNLLDWLAQQDARIQVIHQPNTGIVEALNRGCSLASAPLICRMDADDIAMPSRLQQQATYLRNHPTCIVVGSAILEVDAESDPLRISRLATEHDRILDDLLHRRTGHFHPTTMFRAEAFEAVGGYRTAFQWVEDHDLWLRLAQRGKLANLPEVLLCYRQHATSVCWQRSAQQRNLMNELLKDAYRARGADMPESLIVESTRTRSEAGPGKWARAASKGGYPRSVYKHLQLLFKSKARPAYKARMAAEAMSRLAINYPWRLLSTAVRVPTFAAWHARAANELSKSAKQAA